MSTSAGVLTRAVEDARHHTTNSTAPAWVDSTVAPRVHTWLPLPQWEQLFLTTPEDFRGGLLYTGGAPVWPPPPGTIPRPVRARSTTPAAPRGDAPRAGK